LGLLVEQVRCFCELLRQCPVAIGLRKLCDNGFREMLRLLAKQLPQTQSLARAGGEFADDRLEPSVSPLSASLVGQRFDDRRPIVYVVGQRPKQVGGLPVLASRRTFHLSGV
jgi:hypothetical protein